MPSYADPEGGGDRGRTGRPRGQGLGQAAHAVRRCMLRRVGIAQAIVNDPQLLLLDEPTARPGPRAAGGVPRPAARRVGERATVIVSTHLVEDVGAACSEVALMDAGQIVFRGTPDELTVRGRGSWRGRRPARARLPARSSRRPGHDRDCASARPPRAPRPGHWYCPPPDACSGSRSSSNAVLWVLPLLALLVFFDTYRTVGRVPTGLDRPCPRPSPTGCWSISRAVRPWVLGLGRVPRGPPEDRRTCSARPPARPGRGAPAALAGDDVLAGAAWRSWPRSRRCMSRPRRARRDLGRPAALAGRGRPGRAGHHLRGRIHRRSWCFPAGSPLCSWRSAAVVLHIVGTCTQ